MTSTKSHTSLPVPLLAPVCSLMISVQTGGHACNEILHGKSTAFPTPTINLFITLIGARMTRKRKRILASLDRRHFVKLAREAKKERKKDPKFLVLGMEVAELKVKSI